MMRSPSGAPLRTALRVRSWSSAPSWCAPYTGARKLRIRSGMGNSVSRGARLAVER